jgi:hypothetical protein
MTILGSMYQGAEQWQMGFYVGKEDADCPSPTQADCDALAARAKTYFNTAGTNISWTVVPNEAKIANMAAGGYTITQDTKFSAITGCAGQMARNGTPQDALAVTLTSTRARGTAAKGRFYLPVWECIPTATGHVDPADVTRQLNATKTFLDGVNADVASKGLYIVLASHGNSAKGEAPLNARVTGVRIGDVIDTIQRRRRQIREGYQMAALA